MEIAVMHSGARHKINDELPYNFTDEVASYPLFCLIVSTLLSDVEVRFGYMEYYLYVFPDGADFPSHRVSASFGNAPNTVFLEKLRPITPKEYLDAIEAAQQRGLAKVKLYSKENKARAKLIAQLQEANEKQHC